MSSCEWNYPSVGDWKTLFFGLGITVTRAEHIFMMPRLFILDGCHLFSVGVNRIGFSCVGTLLGRKLLCSLFRQ